MLIGAGITGRRGLCESNVEKELGKGGKHGETGVVRGHNERTFRKASFTRGSVMSPFRHRFSMRSTLEPPELRQAMLMPRWKDRW